MHLDKIRKIIIRMSSAELAQNGVNVKIALLKSETTMNCVRRAIVYGHTRLEKAQPECMPKNLEHLIYRMKTNATLFMLPFL